MFLTVLAGIILIMTFISAVNYHFQKQKYKYATDDVLKKLSLLESPSTWSFLSFVWAFLLVGILVLQIGYLGRGLSDFSDQKDSINQQIDESTSQTTDTEETK